MVIPRLLESFVLHYHGRLSQIIKLLPEWSVHRRRNAAQQPTTFCVLLSVRSRYLLLFCFIFSPETRNKNANCTNYMSDLLLFFCFLVLFGKVSMNRSITSVKLNYRVVRSEEFLNKLSVSVVKSFRNKCASKRFLNDRVSKQHSNTFLKGSMLVWRRSFWRRLRFGADLIYPTLRVGPQFLIFLSL